MRSYAASLAALAPIAALAACSTTGGSGGGSAPLDVPRGEEPMTNTSALVLRSAGLDALLVDPRDQGLRGALAMVGPRILELPEELGEDDGPPPFLVEWVLDVLASPMSLSIDLDPDGDWAAGPPVEARLVVDARDADHARALSADFEKLLGFALPAPGDPHPSRSGLRVVQTPAGGLAYGTPAGSETFVVSWGDGDDGPLGLGSLDLPAGVEPVLAFKLDMGRISPAIEMALGMAGPDGDEARRQLEAFGLLGDEPLMVTAAMGHADDHSRCAVRYANWVPMARQMGMLPAEDLTAADLAMVPADATYASVTKIDLSYVVKMVRTMAAGADEDFDPLAMLHQFLGIDVERDLLDHLGTTVGFYLSDTTGGGGLLSAVLFVAVEDEAGLTGTVDHLASALDGIGSTEADGRVRVHEWEHDGVACTSLIFPGLPIPLEPSMALTDGWMLEAATPQALIAALDRLDSGGPGLLAAPGVGISSAEGLFSINYTDTERLLPDGYGYSALLFSALANAVRSVSDDRDPGPILPSYPELAEGVGPTVLVGRIEGDDLVVLGRGERAATVQLTALLGSPLAKIIAAGVAAGVAVPLVMKAQSLELQSHHAREQAQAAEGRALELQEALQALEASDDPDDGHVHDHDHDHDHDHEGDGR